MALHVPFSSCCRWLRMPSWQLRSRRNRRHRKRPRPPTVQARQANDHSGHFRPWEVGFWWGGTSENTCILTLGIDLPTTGGPLYVSSQNTLFSPSNRNRINGYFLDTISRYLFGWSVADSPFGKQLQVTILSNCEGFWKSEPRMILGIKSSSSWKKKRPVKHRESLGLLRNFQGFGVKDLSNLCALAH